MNDTIDPRLNVVILDDNKVFADHLRLLFVKEGHPKAKVTAFSSVTVFCQALQTIDDVHVAVLDKNLGTLDPQTGKEVHAGDRIVRDLQTRFGPLIIVVVTAFPDDREEEKLRDDNVHAVLKKGGRSGDLQDVFPEIRRIILKYQGPILGTRP